MSAEHTPGPWTFVEREVMEDGSVYPRHIIGSGAGLQVCMMESSAVAHMAQKDPSSIWALNAVTPVNGRLIAAAPELLAELKEMVRMAENEGWTGFERAKAAIAKASPSTTADAGVVG